MDFASCFYKLSTPSFPSWSKSVYYLAGALVPGWVLMSVGLLLSWMWLMETDSTGIEIPECRGGCWVLIWVCGILFCACDDIPQLLLVERI